MYDVIIIGAGPAGLTAAIYLGRAGKKVLILEKNVYGGQIVNSKEVENYPAISKISGFEFSNNLYNQAKNFGAELKYETVVNLTKDKEVTTNRGKYQAKSIIIATGLSNRTLEIDGVDSFIGRGISYCATCDGNFFKDKVVAVVGGGNTALEDAIFLSNICKKVYIIHRRTAFRGEKILQDILNKKENVEFILNSNVVKINGNELLESIIINTNNEEKELQIDGLFLAIGQIPNNSYIDIIDLDEKGYAIANEDCKTNIDGIYVAGDFRTKKVRQLVTAASDGATAAINAIEYIERSDKK
ncbi:MAG: thioredoxin-disulfide reductase [Bacilli bacterium]|nr:thioredoxin-disulfide reductase [Bacilli bacterium]